MEQRHAIDLDATAKEALAAVDDAAEIWGGEWQAMGSGGRLSLPVAAGLRYGLVHGEVFVEPARNGSSLVYRILEREYKIHFGAVVVLLFGALGGLATVVVPFYPNLFQLLPISILLILLAWFLVVARLRHNGPEEFLKLVKDVVEGEGGS